MIDEAVASGGAAPAEGNHGGGEAEVFDPAPHRPSRKNLVTVGVLAIVLFGALLATGVIPRVLQRRELVEAEKAASAETPGVPVARAKLAASSAGLELPGSMQPLQETNVYARANGYMRRWLVDIGARVKKGDVLAELDVPDIEQELRQARASAAQANAGIAQAQTQLDFANTTTHRYSTLGKVGVVSQQEVDQYQSSSDVQKSNVTASQAAFTSAQANVNRLVDLKSFAIITAPFDGVITMRTAEVGQLVVSGAGAGQALFKVAQIDVLRVFVNVPQLYAGGIQVGMPAPTHVREMPGRTFAGTVARTSNELDPLTRSMLTEVDIPNPDGALIAGMYAKVQLDVKRTDRVLFVPSTAVLFNADGTRVAVIDAGGVVHWKTVTIDGDMGDRLAIATGLAENDTVAVVPSEQLVEGMHVRAVEKPEDPKQASAPKPPAKP